jgi:hypothetical protein
MTCRRAFSWRVGEGLLRGSWGLLLVAANVAALSAQATTHPAFREPIAAGDTVQVDAPPGIPTISRARVVDLRPSAMVVHADGATSDPVVPYKQIKWLAVRRGTRGHTVAGGLIGLATGAVIVGAIYSIRNQKSGNLGSTLSQVAAIGAGTGGIIGGVVGTTIRSDRWVPIINREGVEQVEVRESADVPQFAEGHHP